MKRAELLPVVSCAADKASAPGSLSINAEDTSPIKRARTALIETSVSGVGLLQLPLDALIHVASFIPFVPRLRVLSRVCKRLRRSALCSVTFYRCCGLHSRAVPEVIALFPNLRRIAVDNCEVQFLPPSLQVILLGKTPIAALSKLAKIGLPSLLDVHFTQLSALGLEFPPEAAPSSPSFLRFITVHAPQLRVLDLRGDFSFAIHRLQFPLLSVLTVNALCLQAFDKSNLPKLAALELHAGELPAKNLRAQLNPLLQRVTKLYVRGLTSWTPVREPGCQFCQGLQ